MSDMTKTFVLGDVLSITTGCLLSPRHMEGVYDILNFMSGDNLFTHQLPRVADECRPFLLEQFPQLKDVDASSVNSKNCEGWLSDQVAKYGDKFQVQRMPKDAHERIDPLSELAEKVHPDKIIVVRI